MRLPPDLENDLRDAVLVLTARCPEVAEETGHFLKALAVGSPVLSVRLRVMMDNALGGPGRHQLSQEEMQHLGHCLLALEEYARTGKRGARTRGNEYRLMVYLTEEENQSLRHYCEQQRLSRAETVRRGLRRLLEEPETRGTDNQRAVSGKGIDADPGA